MPNTWIPPGPPDPTLRMAKCPRCGAQYTDVPNVIFACTNVRFGPYPWTLCATPTRIAPDPT